MENRFSTNTPIDIILNGGIEKSAITTIYGPPGSGKTNIALCSSIEAEKRNLDIIYIDSENSFSIERFKQLNKGKEPENIILREPETWKDQINEIQSLNSLEKTGLIIVDSITSLYQLEFDASNYQKTNRELAIQYAKLSTISKKLNIPVIITNHVYSSANGVQMIANRIGGYWSKSIIELKKLKEPNMRVAIIKKHRSLPEEKQVLFKIEETKLKFIDENEKYEF